MKIKIVKSSTKSKPYLIEVWAEELWIGEYDMRKVHDAFAIKSDIGLCKRVLRHFGYKPSLVRETVIRE